jgi:hypothetical protein
MIILASFIYKSMIPDVNHREKVITKFVEAYNRFDIPGMLQCLSHDIVFENVSNGKVNLNLHGIEVFREQAEKAAAAFTQRKQNILSFHHSDQKNTVEIEYEATLAIDLSESMKAGEELHLKGQSIYEFMGDKISVLTDIS